MKILGHRRFPGGNVYHDGPVDYLVVRVQAGDDTASLQPFANGSSDMGAAIGTSALVLQRACGVHAKFHNAWQDPDGDWVIVTESKDEDVARAAAAAAVDLVNGELSSDEAEQAVRTARELAMPDFAMRAIVDAANERGIPVLHRGGDHYQLGWGNKQHQLKGLMTDQTSGLGYEISNDNERILEIFEDTGIPTPLGGSRRTLRGIEELAEDLRYPLTVKPLRGRGGVTPLVAGPEELEAAYDCAKEFHRWVVVEDHIAGNGHQILVAGGQVVSAVRLPDTDVTDTLHPAVRLVAERAARHCHMDRVAVDIVAEDLERPLDETRGKVVSMDPEPDLAIHRDISGAVLDDLFDDDGRIPLVAVTGTNGKTTTVRLISHILKYSGGRVGMACTGAVEVENQVILEGDYSGPTAARTVLQEPGISHAVCEVARGGILRRGLGFDLCDVSVFLNVASDHLGQGGIETVDDLAHLKGVVVRATAPGGAAVLNADDPRVWEQRHQLERVIPFSMNADHPDIGGHLAATPDNVAIVFDGTHIVIRRGGATFQISDIMEIPITLNGAARFNIENAMAAVGAAFALGVSEEDTRAGLVTFNPSTGQLPGRMNLQDLGGVRVLIDYGHNVPALKALAEVLPRLAPGRKINVANASGNRRDEDLHAFGVQIAKMYDRIVLCDPDPRRRKTGETAIVIEAGIRAGGMTDGLTVELDEGRALRLALAESKPGDLVVLQADDVGGAIALLNDIRTRLEAGESPGDLNDFLTS